MLKTTYHNRGNTPRNTSTTGQFLPSARFVSQTVFNVTQHSQQEDISTLVMQYGQFLDHDITASPNGDVEQEPESGFSQKTELRNQTIVSQFPYQRMTHSGAAREGGVCSLQEQNQVQRWVAKLSLHIADMCGKCLLFMSLRVHLTFALKMYVYQNSELRIRNMGTTE